MLSCKIQKGKMKLKSKRQETGYQKLPKNVSYPANIKDAPPGVSI